VAAAAKAMKITRQQLHNVMQGRSAVSPEWRCALKGVRRKRRHVVAMQAAYDWLKREGSGQNEHPSTCGAAAP